MGGDGGKVGECRAKLLIVGWEGEAQGQEERRGDIDPPFDDVLERVRNFAGGWCRFGPSWGFRSDGDPRVARKQLSSMSFACTTDHPGEEQEHEGNGHHDHVLTRSTSSQQVPLLCQSATTQLTTLAAEYSIAHRVPPF